MGNKNEVFEYLIEQLRQQVNNNQCEDLAHELLSLKNQLRDTSALVAELQNELDTANNTVVRLRKGFAPGFTKKCLDCGAKLKLPASYLSGYCPRAICTWRHQKRFTQWRRASQRHVPQRTRTSCFRVTSPTIQRYVLSAHLSDLVNRRSDYGTEI